MDRNKKVQQGRKTIDYLYGIVKKNKEISKALADIGLDELVPNTTNYSEILSDTSSLLVEEMGPTIDQKLKQITDQSIQYSKDLARLYLHLFSSPDIHISRKLKLPKESGIYKFIVYADQEDYSELKTEINKGEKIKRILPDIILEAGTEKEHKQISIKNDLDDRIFLYGGGRINLDRENKKIKLYGESGSYGKVSNNLIHRLTKELKDDGYEVIAEMGIGY